MPDQTALSQIAEMANRMRPHWAKAEKAAIEAELELAAIGPEPDLVRAGALVVIMLERGAA